MTDVLKYAGAFIVFVAAYWTFLFVMQRRIMFPAPPPFANATPPADGRQVWLESAAGRTEAWFLPPTVPVDSPPPLLMFAHGNGELIEHWADAFEEPRRWGLAVFLVEFPGYGRSGGSPSEGSIGETFRAAYDWALAEGNVDGTRVVGYGRSLGGGAVAGLARERALAGLILESSFTSTRPLARRFGAPGFLVRDSFDTQAVVETFRGAILVIHGSQDEIIPVEHGRALARAGNVAIHEMECGHNDCPRSWPVVKQFLVDGGIVLVGDPGR